MAVHQQLYVKPPSLRPSWVPALGCAVLTPQHWRGTFDRVQLGCWWCWVFLTVHTPVRMISLALCRKEVWVTQSYGVSEASFGGKKKRQEAQTSPSVCLSYFPIKSEREIGVLGQFLLIKTGSSSQEQMSVGNLLPQRICWGDHFPGEPSSVSCSLGQVAPAWPWASQPPVPMGMSSGQQEVAWPHPAVGSPWPYGRADQTAREDPGLEQAISSSEENSLNHIN